MLLKRTREHTHVSCCLQTVTTNANTYALTSVIYVPYINTRLLKHTTVTHMRCLLPLPRACTLHGDSPPSGMAHPISAAQLQLECAPRASGSLASRNHGDASHSVYPQNRGDRRSGPRYRSAKKQSREGCSDSVHTPGALHPTSSLAGAIRCGGVGWVQTRNQ